MGGTENDHLRSVLGLLCSPAESTEVDSGLRDGSDRVGTRLAACVDRLSRNLQNRREMWHMACIAYKRLVTEWMILIYKPHSDQAAATAYWEAVEHRVKCEVCRDETLADGCSGIYAVIAPSTH